MKKRPRILLDVDDVLVDFETPAEKLVSDLLGREWTLAEGPQEWDLFQALSKQQFKLAMQLIHVPGWSNCLLPFTKAQTAVSILQEIGDVYAVTAAIPWASDRCGYLDHHFGIDKNHQVYTKAKYLVSGDFFVEDNPSNLQQWLAENRQGKGIFWNTRNNQRVEGYDKLRVSSWEEVIEMVRAFGGKKV